MEGFFVSFHSPESVSTFSILGALALALISFPVFGDSIMSISIVATTSEGPVRAYAVPTQTHSSSKGETAENSLNLYEMSCQFTCLVHTLSLKGGGCTGLLATRYRTSMLFGSGQEQGPLKLFVVLMRQTLDVLTLVAGLSGISFPYSCCPPDMQTHVVYAQARCRWVLWTRHSEAFSLCNA